MQEDKLYLNLVSETFWHARHGKGQVFHTNYALGDNIIYIAHHPLHDNAKRALYRDGDNSTLYNY